MKGISFFYGYSSDYKKRAKLIKEQGFECVITTADPRLNKQNGTIRKQVKLFKKLGLKLSSLHMTYNENELPNFFMDNEIGEKIEKQIIKDLNIAKKYKFKCVVVHLVGEFNDIGLNRLLRIVDVCKKVNVPIAVENLDGNFELLKHVFDTFSSDYVKFCFDSGHQNCFEPDIDYLSMYGDRLICVHLHDNMGDSDSHTLNKYGNIDWNKIASQLSKTNYVDLDYELLMKYKNGDETEEEVLKLCFEEACELESALSKMPINS